MGRGITVVMSMFVVALLATTSLPAPVWASNSKQLQISVAAASPVFPGQTVQITATVQFSNGTAVGNKASFAGSHIYYPNGTAVALPAKTVTAPELVRWSYNVPSNAPNGLYTVTIKATVLANVTWGQASFTVNSQLASASGLAAIGSQLTSLGSQLTSLSSRVHLLSSDMSGNFTAVLNVLSADFGDIQGQVSGLSSSMATNFTALSGALTNLRGAVGSLATSASISDLKSTVQNEIGSIDTGIGSLANSSQVAALTNALQGVSSQVSGTSSVVDYVLLPIVVAALVLILMIVLRRRQ
ncbi:MAG: hypothetical protein HY297_00375 [Thaumarchaeota archaeon]|nr:hypothetical protein [Nitrososphaerota archaeon]